MIKKLINEARGNAWARMSDLPEVLALQQIASEKIISRNLKTDQTTKAKILNIYK